MTAPLVASPFPSSWRDFAPPVWLEHWRVGRVAVDGGELECVECGDGPALVLLPPLPGWKEAFVALLPVLARRFRVFALDLRSRFAGAPAWDALVADAEQVAAARFGGPVAVLGHSFGGALALRWALAHPGRIRALVISSGFARLLTPPGAWAARYLEQPLALAGMRLLPDRASAALALRLAAARRWVFDPHCDERVVEMVRLGIRHLPIGLARQRIRLAFGHDIRAALGDIACPTLVVRGEHDTPFAIATADELAAGIPVAARVEIAGGGHLHPLSRPDELGRAVTEWLSTVSP